MIALEFLKSELKSHNMELIAKMIGGRRLIFNHR